MIAVIDETVPTVPQGSVYVVVGVVLLTDADTARPELAKVIGDRKRAFHWTTDGPQRRNDMADQLEALGALARGFAKPCGRRGQERARYSIMPIAIGWAVTQGAAEIIIESRDSVQDGRDRQVVAAALESLGVPELPVSWRTKAEPLLWAADAVAGCAHNHLIGLATDEEHKRMWEITELDIEYVQT